MGAMTALGSCAQSSAEGAECGSADAAMHRAVRGCASCARTPDRGARCRRLCSDLIADALRRCLAASGIAGVRAIVAHAIDEQGAGFYLGYGFVLSPLGERVTLMPIEVVRASR
jgi:hypothetical protein